MRKISKNPGCWRKLTIAERCIIFVYITFIGLTEVNTVMGARATSMMDGQCFEHNNTAEAVLSKLKQEVKPCDDFYQFACGNFIDKVEIPKEDFKETSFNQIFRELQKQLKDIITEERAEVEPKYLKFPNLLYKACMNESLLETFGMKPIKQISDSLGGWPVIVGDSWDSNKTWTWQETAQKCKKLGLTPNYLLVFEVTVDLNNSKRHIIAVDQPETGLSREYLLKGFNEPVVSAYYDLMVDIAVLFGAKKETAEKELRDSLQFEIDLANISWPNEKRMDASVWYNIRYIKELQESYPFMDWLDHINALLPEDINNNEGVNLYEPSFLDDLGKLLGRTDSRVIANYFMWRIYYYSLPFLTEKLRNRLLEFEKVSIGRHERLPRWKECVNIVSGEDENHLGVISQHSLHVALGSLYVRKYFKQEYKALLLEILGNIRKAFSQMLDKAEWMDPETKQKAQEKLRAMTANIAYPEELLDNDKLEEYYRGLEIDPDKYFQSILNMNIFNMDFSFRKLRLPVVKNDWIELSRVATVNILSNLIDNSILFTAGILQGHYFNAQRPNYMNYGSIGFGIGQAIANGFSDTGRLYNADGNLDDWMQPNTTKAFLEKIKCIVEQYSGFKDEQTGLNVNGDSTKTHNINANGGITAAYSAYQQLKSNNDEEPRLCGLDYTPNQMFWISFAQSWCAKYKTEKLKMIIKSDIHTPDKYYVLGALLNTKEFSRDFQCPEDAPMNPEHKCKIF